MEIPHAKIKNVQLFSFCVSATVISGIFTIYTNDFFFQKDVLCVLFKINKWIIRNHIP